MLNRSMRLGLKMRSFLGLLMVANAVLLGGCDWITKDRDQTSAQEITQNTIERTGRAPDPNDKALDSETHDDAAVPELSSELISEYNSKLIKDDGEFYLENGAFCDRHKIEGTCRIERKRRQNWNFAILNEIGRHEFLREFKGEKTLIIPGDSEASGEYKIYNEWFQDSEVNGTVYIGKARPYDEELLWIPFAYIGNSPNSFQVPFYNYDKRRGYTKNADAYIRWVVVNCEKKTQFVNLVDYFKGDIRKLDFFARYANQDKILDYNIVFSRLQSLMTNEYPFDHTPSSPFNDVCS